MGSKSRRYSRRKRSKRKEYDSDSYSSSYDSYSDESSSSSSSYYRRSRRHKSYDSYSDESSSSSSSSSYYRRMRRHKSYDSYSDESSSCSSSSSLYYRRKRRRKSYDSYSDESSSSSSSSSSNYRRKRKRKSSNRKRKSSSPVKRKIVNKLTMDDFYRMNPEFREWLINSKKIIASEISTDESKKYFKKFISRWNKGKLNDRYYRSIESPLIGAKMRTSYEWNFKGVDDVTLKNVRLNVEKLTSNGIVKDEQIEWSEKLLPLDKKMN